MDGMLMNKVSKLLMLFLAGMYAVFLSFSVQAEATPAATPQKVEAKNETFSAPHPDQYKSWQATSE